MTGRGTAAGLVKPGFPVPETIVIWSRFFTRRPDLGGLIGNNVFDESRDG